MSSGIGMGLMLCLLLPHIPYFDSRQSLVETLQRFNLPEGRMIDQRLWKYFSPDSQQRGHLWNLFMMNQVIEQNPTPEFEHKLLTLVLASSPNMLATGIQFVIPTVVAKLGRWQHKRPLVCAWEVVEFVSLMQFSSSAGLQAAQSAMSAWLAGFPEADIDMTPLKQGILTGWDRDHLAFPMWLTDKPQAV